MGKRRESHGRNPGIRGRGCPAHGRDSITSGTIGIEDHFQSGGRSSTRPTVSRNHGANSRGIAAHPENGAGTATFALAGSDSACWVHWDTKGVLLRYFSPFRPFARRRYCPRTTRTTPGRASTSVAPQRRAGTGLRSSRSRRTALPGARRPSAGSSPGPTQTGRSRPRT